MLAVAAAAVSGMCELWLRGRIQLYGQWYVCVCVECSLSCNAQQGSLTLLLLPPRSRSLTHYSALRSLCCVAQRAAVNAILSVAAVVPVVYDISPGYSPRTPIFPPTFPLQ